MKGRTYEMVKEATQEVCRLVIQKFLQIRGRKKDD